MSDRLILAYSGGLDTSVAIRWIQEKYSYDVYTITVDVGQQEDMKAIGERALAIGSKAHFSVDAREEFVRGYVFPSIRANGLYEGKYPLSAALARPLIAKKLVEKADEVGATAVAHGCTGKGNDQVRFDVMISALNPNLKIVAPVREWSLSRDEEIMYAQEHGVPIKPSASVYSVDQNLWGRSVESGPLEDPSQEPPNDAFEWTGSPEDAPDEAGYVEITFWDGVPSALDGVESRPVELIDRLNRFAGMHGVGRIDHMEDRLVGIKSREVYECPAAVVLLEAHKDLEKLVLTRHELVFKSLVEQEWAWLVYSGLWVDPLKEDLEAFIEKTQKRVEGKVRVKLHKGNCKVVGRSSPYSLYDVSLATYDSSSKFDQRAAEGFIRIWGLPSRVAYRASSRSKEVYR